jgi:hypothetical protein
MATNILERFKEAGISMVGDLITFGLLRKREAKPEKPAGITEAVKTIVPHFMGLGPEDEAIFTATLAKLDYSMNIHIARFLKKLSSHQVARFIESVAVIPNDADRIKVLEMYGKLPLKEMVLLAKSTRMTGVDTFKHMTGVAESILGKSGLNELLESANTNAQDMADKINLANDEFDLRRANREINHPKLFRLLSYK